MSKKKQKQLQVNHIKKSEKYLIWCLTLAAAVIPLLIRIIAVNYDATNTAWYLNHGPFYDIYSKIKANAIIVMTLMSGLAFIYYRVQKKDLKFFKSPLVIIAGISIVSFLISSLFSPYPYQAFHGYVERYEGFPIYLAYMLLFVFAYSVDWNKDKLSFFFKGFWISNILLSLVGLLQMAGINPITSNAIKPFILPSGIANVNLTDLLAGVKVISQTLYHYNYVGLFIALSFPIFLSLGLHEKHLIKKLSLLGTALLILVNLLASSARGGLVGVAFGLIFFIIFNRHLLFKNLKIVIPILIVMLGVGAGYEVYSDGFVTSRVKQIFNLDKVDYRLDAIDVENNDTIVLKLNEDTFAVNITDHTPTSWAYHFTLNGQTLNYDFNDQNFIYFDEPALQGINIFYTTYPESSDYHLAIKMDNIVWPFVYQDNALVYRSPYGDYLKPMSDVPRLESLDGLEHVGSARFYIWSRLIPAGLNHPLWGTGPDTAEIVFPQNDYLGKVHAYGTDNMIVDKAHNIYLQYFISFGFIGLALLILLLIYFIVVGVKTLSKQKFTFTDGYQSGLFLAIIGFMAAAFFNDSNVHVSPVFWILMGMAFSYFKSINRQYLD